MGQSKWAGACALVVVVGLVVSSHGEDAGQNPSTAGEPAADAAPAKDHADSFADHEIFPTRELAKRRIEFILDQPLKSPLQYPETPLNTVTGIISEEYDIPIVFDTKALEAIAVSPDVQVGVDLQNVTLRSALDLMLKQVEDLTYVVDHEVLQITSEDEANKRLEVRIYRVDDLTELMISEPSHEGGSSGGGFDPLLDAITSCIDRDTWQENGTGEGEIQPLPPGLFVITQTARIHREVEEFLTDLRRVVHAIEADASRKREGDSQTALAP